jgi:hypothetical protein
MSRRRACAGAFEECRDSPGRHRGRQPGRDPGTLNLIVMQREAEMMQKALTVFHTEFNKIATEDLPRV